MYPKDSQNAIREFMIWWNANFPIDYWYRQKFNIRFNSESHRELSLFDILCEWEEQNLTIELHNEIFDEKQFEEYKKTGIWLRGRDEETKDEDWDRFFEDDNFELFDDKQ